eukprot:3744140-Prymnesium_polylepis.1
MRVPCAERYITNWPRRARCVCGGGEPSSRSHRVLRRRLRLRVVLRSGAACRTALEAALRRAPTVRPRGGQSARRTPGSGSCEQRARPAAAGWRLRFEAVPASGGPDGRR